LSNGDRGFARFVVALGLDTDFFLLRSAVFLVAVVLVVVFLVAVFLAVLAFLAAVFLAAGPLAVLFFAAAFLVAVFLAAGLLAVLVFFGFDADEVERFLVVGLDFFVLFDLLLTTAILLLLLVGDLRPSTHPPLPTPTKPEARSPRTDVTPGWRLAECTLPQARSQRPRNRGTSPRYQDGVGRLQRRS